MTKPPGILDKSVLLHHCQCRQRGSTGNRIATKRSPVRTRQPLLHESGTGSDRSQRESGRNRFADRHNVRNDASVLTRPPFAGTSHTALDLINHQQHAVSVAEDAQPFHEVYRYGDISTFSLNGFNDNGCYLLRRDRVSEKDLFQIISAGDSTSRRVLLQWTTETIGKGSVIHLGKQGTVLTAIACRSSGQGKRPEGATMERAGKGDNARASGCITR